jgi:hypothetical protein
VDLEEVEMEGVEMVEEVMAVVDWVVVEMVVEMVEEEMVVVD